MQNIYPLQNQLQVYGPQAERERFVKENRGYGPRHSNDRDLPDDLNILDLSFHAGVAVPDEILNVPFTAKRANWFEHHWGSRYEPDVRAIVSDDVNTRYLFETDYSSPNKWLQCVSAKYSSLSFDLTFLEVFDQIAGHFSFSNGVMTEVSQWDTVNLYLEALGTHRYPYGWGIDAAKERLACRCPGCKVLPFRAHHIGCVYETCPRCGRRIMACGCCSKQTIWEEYVGCRDIDG